MGRAGARTGEYDGIDEWQRLDEDSISEQLSRLGGARRSGRRACRKRCP